MTRTQKLRGWAFAGLMLSMAIVNIYLLWESRLAMAKGYPDFANFYTAGALLDRGQAGEIYDRAAQWRVQQEFASEVKVRQGPLRYLRPPFEAPLFAVFARWPFPQAFLLWTVFKLVLLSAIPFVVVRRRRWEECFPLWLVPLLVLGTIPGFIDLLHGQDAALLAFLVAVAFWQLDEERDASAGVALGLALIKFQLVLPIVLAICVAGRKRVLAGFVPCALALVALSAAVVGWKGVLRYPAYLLSFNQSTGVGVAPQLQMNLRGLLTLVLGRSPYPGRIHWLLGPVAVAAIVYVGRLWRKAGPRFLTEGFALALLTAIVTSYYAYSYDLLLLIVPLLAMRTRPGSSMEGSRVVALLEAAGLALVLFTPAYLFARLGNQCLMTLPLLALMVALWMRLRAGRETAKGQSPRIASARA